MTEPPDTASTEQTSQRHWVEDLFPPHFTVKLSELTEKPKAADPGTLEAWRLSQRTKMRDIYEEVREKMIAEARIKKDKSIQAGAPMGETIHGVRLEGQARRLAGTPKGDGQNRLCTNEKRNKENQADAMWTSEEMAILRKEFQRVKEERQILGLELHSVQKEFNELEAKFKKQRKVCDSKIAKLKQSQQESERLLVQQKFDAKELKLLQSKLAMAEDDYRDALEQRLSLRKELAGMRQSCSKAQQEVKELRIKLAEAESRHKLEILEREEAMRLDYESQIASLYQELTDTRAELDREQTEHRRSKKALDHLRIHFAQVAHSQDQSQPSDSDAMSNLQIF